MRLVLLAVSLAACGCVSVNRQGGAGRPARGQTGAAVQVSAAPLDVRETIRHSALSYVGTPYRTGGSDRSALDCSGLTQRIFSDQGIALPRTVFDQFKRGKPRWRTELKPGDLVFFETRREAGATHVGVFVGDGRFVHAPSSGKVVEVAELSLPHWRDAFLAGRDVVDGR